MIIDDFDRLTDSFMEHVSENVRGGFVPYYTACIRQLREFLLNRGLSYSPEAAESWLKEVEGDTAKSTFGIYRATVNKLNDLLLYGEIQVRHGGGRKTMASGLNDEFTGVWKGFTEWISKGQSPVTVSNNGNYCARILMDLQNAGVNSVSEITYDTLIEEMEKIDKKPYYFKSYLHMGFNMLTDYLYERGLIPYGYALLIDCMTKGSVFPVIRLTEKEKSRLAESTENEETADLDEYLRLCDEIYAEHVKEKYSPTALDKIRSNTNRFYLFMDMNGLRYSPACGDAWLGSIEPHIGTGEFKIYRRTVSLIKERFNGTGFRLGSNFVFRETALSRLPSWCREDVENFLDMKAKEGWARNTLDMYRASVCRFCDSLDKAGIQSFTNLTPEDIKRFNATDVHSTPEGKNAYNSRIRKFLEYLGDTGKLTNRYLYMALPSACTRREHIVTVLTEDEQRKVTEALSEDNTEITLRDKAMISLGFYLGLRSCDVVGLAIDDIDWDACTIRVLQDKTDREILLPMPVQVANALYRYIMYERPVSPKKEVFLRNKAPYHPVARDVCEDAIKRVLPAYTAPGSGFHVLRKTYATNLLRNDAGVQEVAEALGHKNLTSVDKYLSLDEERMRECAFSLESRNLSYKGGF